MHLIRQQNLIWLVFKKKTDKIDESKLKIAPVDLSKLSNVIENDVVKKALCNKEKIKN